jgi:hypothetical protein
MVIQIFKRYKSPDIDQILVELTQSRSKTLCSVRTVSRGYGVICCTYLFRRIRRVIKLIIEIIRTQQNFIKHSDVLT